MGSESDQMPNLPPIEGFLTEIATAQELPNLAIAMCTVQFPESGPALRDVLRRAADGESLTEEDETLLFRGLYILGGRRDPQSFDPLMRLLHRPPEEVDRLLGLAVTETLARIVVGVFNGNSDALFAAIADRRLDEFVREALLGAATFLAWEGRIDPVQMVSFLKLFHDERLADDEDMAWVAWLNAIALLDLRPLKPLAKRAWKDGRIPGGILEWQDFEADLARAQRAFDDVARFKRINAGYIDDVVDALARTCRSEAWFVDGEESPGEEELFDDEELLNLDDESLPLSATDFPAMPASNPLRHVGRNDPCPCGSGKKFKKCCLGA